LLNAVKRDFIAMKNIRLFILLFMTGLLCACASTTSNGVKVHHINTLASPEINTGSFRGLENLSNNIDGQKRRVNIMYLHGIGWTEDRTKEQLASDFLGGIAKAYDLDSTDGLVRTTCGEAPYDPNATTPEFIHIKSNTPRLFDTVIPGSQLKLDKLVCMDKQTLPIRDDTEFVIYRVFWDNIFWDDIQFSHVGQDDNRGTSKEIAGLRRKYNRILKDDFINYGISDAVMYLGSAGTEIRKAIKGAMCSAALDAAGTNFVQQGGVVSYDTLCNRASFGNIKPGKFAFITESLGSKITLDVMQEALSDGRETIHDDMIRGSETYMLANQIPLLSLSNISETRAPAIAKLADHDRPKIIAMSELNDFLSYELVPFYEQLWKRSIRQNQSNNAPLDSYLRAQIIKDIGFEIIDMRLEFADKIIPLVSDFVDPKEAHSGHAKEPELMRYILCGANTGELSLTGCEAALDAQEKSKKAKKKARKKAEKKAREEAEKKAKEKAKEKAREKALQEADKIAKLDAS